MLKKEALVALILYASLGLSVCQSEDFPNSLNYLVISKVLISSDEVQEVLKITPPQLTALKAIIANPNFSSLITNTEMSVVIDESKERREIWADKASSRLEKFRKISQLSEERNRNGDCPITTSVNKEVRPALEKILNDKQMSQLRPVILKMKFTEGWRPFFDKEVLRCCQVPDTWHITQPIVKDDAVIKDYYIRLQKIGIEACSSILSILPEGAQERFVNYAGTSFSPNIQPTNDLASLSFQKCGYLGQFLDSSDAKALNLSDDQTRHLRQACEKHDYTLRYPPRPGMSGAEQFDFALEELDRSVRGILSDSQMLMILREEGRRLLIADPRIPFQNQDFINYLKLDSATAKVVFDFVNMEYQNRVALTRKLDRKIFDEIADTLPSPSKELITNLFAETWDIHFKSDATPQVIFSMGAF